MTSTGKAEMTVNVDIQRTLPSGGRKDVQGQVSGEKQGCSEERKCLRCVEEAIPFALEELEDAYPPRDIEKGEKVGPEMTALHPS